MVERRTPEREVRSSLRSPCCVLEQDTFTSQKVLVIPRKRWLRPDMTKQSLTETLNLNKTKTVSHFPLPGPTNSPPTTTPSGGPCLDTVDNCAFIHSLQPGFCYSRLDYSRVHCRKFVDFVNIFVSHTIDDKYPSVLTAFV